MCQIMVRDRSQTCNVLRYIYIRELACHIRCGLAVDDEGDDQAVKTEDLCKDQDDDHPHEKARLLRRGPHSGITDDANGNARCQSRQSDAQSGGQM